ncbi:MAG: hypothetical protein K0S12_1900, partial [Bacteroidetes bacterium]|nr:hypothetical protein [Bacteroidota bacterium]
MLSVKNLERVKALAPLGTVETRVRRIYFCR